MTTFPDGVNQWGGCPVGGARFSSPWATHYFVDYDEGSDAFDGTAPQRSKKTIQAAVTLAGRGDVIYVRPRKYTSDGSDVERYIEAVTVPYATADLSMIGVSNTYHGNPNYGAKLQWTTGGGTALTVNAPAFHLENMCVRAETADRGIYLVGGTDYTAAAGSCGSTLYNVVIRGGIDGVLITSGYASQVINCRFEGGTDQDHSIHIDGHTQLGRRHVVQDCHFDSYNGAAIDVANIRVQGSETDLLIYRCTFDIMATSYYIYATGTNLGAVLNCFFADANVNPTTDLTLAGLIQAGNWDTAGILV